MSDHSYSSDSDSSDCSSNGTSVTSDGTGKDSLSHFIDLTYKVIGNYHLIKMLGEGASAQVWLAYNHVRNNFYALKIQHPNDFDSARDELKILRRIEKLPYKIEVIENFAFFLSGKKEKKEKYYVIVLPVYGKSVEELSLMDVFDDGMSESIVRKFTTQTLENFVMLHNKYHLIHCDIKPDNFLLSKPDVRIKRIMESYSKDKFLKVYQKVKSKKPEIENDRKLDMEIREKLHKELIRDIDFESITKMKVSDDEILKQVEESNFLLSDFGGFCDIEDKYNDDFGTRYYRAPENILVSEDLNYATDIWSLGCTIYELLTNHVLFKPSTTSKFSTDHHHLSSIFQLGKFSNKEIKSCGRRKQFFSKKKELLKLPKTSSVIDKINRVESSFWKGLILSMLTVSYKQRPSAKKLLSNFQ